MSDGTSPENRLSRPNLDLAPIPGRDRLVIVDALRGFALVGVLLMNLGAFTGFVFMGPVELASVGVTAADRIAAFAMVWLTHGKFYSLFSLLFGIGFSLQLRAIERRHGGDLTLFHRRLLILLAIGAVHMFVWKGDILFLYAVLGFLLIPLRRLSDRRLLGTVIALLVAPVVLRALIVATGGALDPGAPLNALGRQVLVGTGFSADALPFPTLRDADWGGYVRFQLSAPFFRFEELLSTGRPFKVLAMFLVGLWVGRCGMLHRLAEWEGVLRRVQVWGFAVGLPAAAVQATLMLTGDMGVGWVSVVEAGAYALGVAPLALAYAATFTRLYESSAWRARLERLAPAGRMALTNYLMQTCIGIALFYGIGLGLMGQVGPLWWPALTALIIAGQVVFGRWWLARFAFGPVEWLWRQSTYGRRLPLRRAISAP